MFGARLDARSYTTLLLVVVASLLTLNLMAQYGSNTRDDDYSDAGASRDIASATREVAASTKAVAESNRAIAQAITELARAVRDAGSEVAGKEPAPAADVPVASTTTDAAPSADNAASEQPVAPAATEPGYQGKFELN